MYSKENLCDLEEKFHKVKQLIDSSIADPDTDPYRSKYVARQHLESMKEILNRLITQNRSNCDLCCKIIGMLGAVQLQLGSIAFDTEEFSLAEQHYEECLNIIKDHLPEQEVASVAMNLYNHLGMLWCRRDYTKGVVYFLQAEDFYKELKEQAIIPIDYMDLFNMEYTFDAADAGLKLEKAYTLTLYYLAQCYIKSNPLRSALYCHRTLQRQYDYNDFDCIDWALNTATLSQFLMENNGFKQSRHYLCAATHMLNVHKQRLDETPISECGEEHEAQLENYRLRSADVARCWVKYGLNLLTNSRERLVETENIEVTACTCTDLTEMDHLEEKFGVSKEEVRIMRFENLDLSELEARVTDHFLLTMSDAKKVFLFALEWVTAALEFYTLNTHASDHVEITQDQSKLYDALAFFADDPDVQCKMYKRSSDLLEAVQAAINPQYYMHYCRLNWYHIGGLASDMLDIKMEKLRAGGAGPHAAAKVNMLVEKAVANFTQYIDSFRNASGGLPNRVPDALEANFLRAYFHIGAIQTRYCTTDSEVLVGRIEKAIAAYQALLAYCEVNKSAGDSLKAEVQIAETMASLLRLKVARIRNVPPPPVIAVPSTIT